MSRRFTALRTGPKLAKRLAQVELGSLPDEALMDYAHAEFRQLASQQARVWAAFAEIARRAPLAFDSAAGWTQGQRFDSAASELVAELRVSKPFATHELEHAQDLEAMPTVAAALRAGEIDRNRVLVLLDVCLGLSDAHRDTILTEVLPTAGAVPPAKLRAQAQRIAIALDPEWAERRYRISLREQRVVCYIADDGTVTLSGQNLDAEQAHAAKAHVWALARAAKRAGAHASSDKLRATLFTALLNQHYVGMGQREIIAELVKRFPKPTAAEPTAPTRSSARPEPAIKPEPVVPSGVELRLGLASLMGLTDAPGEVAGAGPVVASVAREIAEMQRRGEWRFAIVDDEGGCCTTASRATARRPTRPAASGAASSNSTSRFTCSTRPSSKNTHSGRGCSATSRSSTPPSSRSSRTPPPARPANPCAGGCRSSTATACSPPAAARPATPRPTTATTTPTAASPSRTISGRFANAITT